MEEYQASVDHFFKLKNNVKNAVQSEEIWDEFLAEVGKAGKPLIACHSVCIFSEFSYIFLLFFLK